MSLFTYLQNFEFTLNVAANILISLCGASAIFLSQSSHEERRKYACILGLIGQPAWFYTSYVSQNWGIFAVCFLYAFSWFKGLWSFWLKPWWKERNEVVETTEELCGMGTGARVCSCIRETRHHH